MQWPSKGRKPCPLVSTESLPLVFLAPHALSIVSCYKCVDCFHGNLEVKILRKVLCLLKIQYRGQHSPHHLHVIIAF